MCGHYVVAACTCFVVPPGNYGRTDTFSCRSSCCCCCCFGLAVGPAVVALPLDAQPCRAVYACVCVCVCVCCARFVRGMPQSRAPRLLTIVGVGEWDVVNVKI